MLLGRRSIWKFYNLQLTTFSFEFVKKLQEIFRTGLQLARLVEARHAKWVSTSWISTKSTHLINIYFKPHANGRNNVGSYILRPFAHPVACCWVFLFCDYRSVAQQSWICLHSSSNIIGATHADYTCSPKYCGAYPSHDALQVSILLRIVAFVCSPDCQHARRNSQHC